MNDTGIYSLEEVREMTLNGIVKEYRKDILEIMSQIKEAAVAGQSEYYFDLKDMEERKFERITFFFRKKGFVVLSALGRDLVRIAW